jgi:ubiquinone biosynthesis protein
MLCLFPAVRAADPVGHLRHFVAGIAEQTDLRIEARNYARFRANFAGVHGVVFPRVHAELSGERVLTMDFVRGRRVHELGPGDHSALAVRLRTAMLKMLFEDGFAHVDLHPGNFVITEKDEIAIFDVGLATLLSEESFVQFLDWNKCLAMGTTDDYVRHLRTYFVRDRDVDWDALTRDVDEFARSFRGRPMAEVEAQDIVGRAFAIGRRYGLRPNTELTLIMVAIITAEGIGKMLEPHVDMLGEIAQYLMPILARRGLLPAATSERRS